MSSAKVSPSASSSDLAGDLLLHVVALVEHERHPGGGIEPASAKSASASARASMVGKKTERIWKLLLVGSRSKMKIKMKWNKNK